MSPTSLRIISFFGILAVLTSAADLVRIPFSELTAVEGGVTAKLQQALKKDGIIAIEGIPGFKQVRRNALTSASALASTDDEHVVARTLADGSVRSTLGTEFNAGAQRLSFSAKLGQANGDKISQLDTMQSSVDDVAAKLSAALDASVKPHSAFFGDQTFHASNGQDGESWDSFNDLMHGGSYLEHVHSYKADTQQNLDGSKALDYHTDAGLFILFTPALYANDAYDRQVKTPDFRFQDRDGKEHAIVVQTPTVSSATTTTTTTTTAPVRQVDGVTVHTVAPDTMVLMVGQGAVQYLNPALVKNGDGGLRAVPHSLSMNTPGVRNWYGRMYLPPAQAWHTEQQTTHAAVRRLLVETTRTTQENTAVQDLALPIGCGLGHPYTAPAPAYAAADSTETPRSLRALPLTYRALEDCPTGTIYCWTMCLVVADYNLNCSYSDVTCVDSSGQPVDPNQHDSSNQPGCVDVAPTDPGGFCQGNGVNMYMSGFVSYVTGKYRTNGGSTTPQCLVLWFEDWELNGKGKFAAGCFGVFLLGIWTESLTSLRRLVRQRTRQLNAKLQTFVMSLLYAIQLMFGYFCMLVAMTYQVELFVCVVLGLGAGHGLFHFKAAEVLPDGRLSEAEKVLRAAADLDEVVDPCCQYLSLDDDSNHSTTQLAAKNGNNQPQAQQGANGLNGKNGGSARANPMH